MRQKTLLPLLTILLMAGLIPVSAQSPSEQLRTGTLLKRTTVNGVDNYPYATYSFKCDGNGPEIQKLCRNNWEIIFGNSPEPDSFGVTMVTDDRSRIRDLGRHTWAEKFFVPTLSAYEEPEQEPSVKALEEHIYLVHSRDTDTNLYALFRVEKLLPGERVDITWKIIPKPSPSDQVRTATLLKRTMTKGVDNYPYTAYSFKFGGNGPEIQKRCHNNWDIVFSDSPEPDSFDVTMTMTDHRSRIRDLGRHTWAEKLFVPPLSAYEEPDQEPSVKALEEHIYLVHARDNDTDLYALFRVEKLSPGERVDITWRVIPKPQR